jgi:invasion protein IalB
MLARRGLARHKHGLAALLDRSKAFDTAKRLRRRAGGKAALPMRGLPFERKRFAPPRIAASAAARLALLAGALLGGGLLACALFGAPLAQAQGVVRAKHGDWETRCETPPGAEHEQCALIQSVAAEDRPNVTLIVIVLKTADGKSRLLRVIAPLGVLIPSGLGLKIDQVDVGRVGFVRCLPNGCVAEVVMEDKLIEQMKNGHSATFIIFQTPEEGIGIPLALNGFKEGFEQLP